jgi:hypothetical protein
LAPAGQWVLPSASNFLGFPRFYASSRVNFRRSKMGSERRLRLKAETRENLVKNKNVKIGVEKVSKALYCLPIAGFGGAGASGSAPVGHLFVHPLFNCIQTPQGK